MVDRYTKQARKYKPDKTPILFIAEAPPNSIDRYFYFEDVRTRDWLWIALMRALFPFEWTQPKEQRGRKRSWLEKFRDSGFYLIDAVKSPITGTRRQRVTKIRENADTLIAEIRTIDPECIILIKATVHEAICEKFKVAGLPIANKAPLPFPSSGQQGKFHERFLQLDCVKKFIAESKRRK